MLIALLMAIGAHAGPLQDGFEAARRDD